ncbi:MAG: hypothetical protein KG003_06485 [Bacteroidetes bacterium]|nr:hypothetical protein [Bacteroidota bacterium]
MSQSKNDNKEEDFYIENGLFILTAKYLLKRGSCCGNRCRNCPYHPRHTKGSNKPAENV